MTNDTEEAREIRNLLELVKRGQHHGLSVRAEFALKDFDRLLANARAEGFARGREMAAQVIDLCGAEASGASKRRLAKAIRAMQDDGAGAPTARRCECGCPAAVHAAVLETGETTACATCDCRALRPADATRAEGEGFCEHNSGRPHHWVTVPELGETHCMYCEKLAPRVR